ncbi:hypothetical protein LCGC14_0446380 [marine sediment metagenome]|uniref:Uncharacterized protein n=1 Tax=marine sediment metagenome TaxID=412755 RepID=A0A0F9VT76_9ZZZZ
MTTREHKPDGPPPGVGIVGTPPRTTLLTVMRALRQNALNSARIGAEAVKSRLMKRIVRRELGERRQCNLQIMWLPGLVTLKCSACDFLAELIPGTDAETKELVRAAADMHGKEA